MPSRLPNAFGLGRPEDSAICVTDGLLDLLDGRELAGVLAHEIGHIANRDLWIMSLADMMSRLVSLASWLGQQNGDLSEGRSSREGCLSGPSPPPVSDVDAPYASPFWRRGGLASPHVSLTGVDRRRP
ncbi:M48 family metalloprotease [Paracoccus sanguinis]|uniref:M48 family metalloprotease n=1 Tax=Paracoccus sanguinis TaxID=1545044 RepID=UPI000A6F173D|nr:M48 family metalloprotease [Paracoccus sanguinis]